MPTGRGFLKAADCRSVGALVSILFADLNQAHPELSNDL